jgi:hypothetical protein
MHQACSIQEGDHLVNQLFNTWSNLDCFADVAGFGAGLSIPIPAA